MAEKHAVIRTDKMFGTDDRVGIYSFKFYEMGDGNKLVPADIDNGHVVKLNKLMDGERELYEAVAPTGSEDLADVVIVASPELNYDERLHSLDDFYNKADRPGRAYTCNKNQIFSVTKNALAGKAEPEKGDVVELAAGTKLNVAASATSGKTQVGYIADVEQVGRFLYYVIEVRNGANA
jgi:hypothetical protein